ncbi:hypothetical protein K450DRAFT_232509 [Umbelopsis ramanniana AG]|uniref:Programmed cell death protein 7 n=1 Tax=Umbelopsis ramanniana AG TaxID=1314678 RepID=A0AAD5HFP5_UMBRA|nr:uncharacterized protein K450DRAFT_232509 [Umbelopsis ramanniana AG]KAI8581324.1 hypothetical protein K450DRAFT_232509 [Umbelopsis ramanniana AG]
MYPHPPNASTYRQWVVHPAPWDNQHMSNHQTIPASMTPQTANLQSAGEGNDSRPVKSELYNNKLKIAKMVLKYEEYRNKLAQASSIASSSEETANIDLNELDSLKEEIAATVKEMSSESHIRRLKQLLSRQKRKREWKRRHLKKLQQTRDKRREKRRRLHEEIDRWRVEWIEKEEENKKKARERQKAEKQRKLEASIRNHERNSQLLVQKLLELRAIRRRKLKAQGHFFPEEGNEFFERIRQLNEQVPSSPSTENEPIEQEVISVPVHEDDKWLHVPLDMNSYSYWCQGNRSLDALQRVRNQWDYYLSTNSSEIGSKVPPTWVNPSPPSNWVWATVLN